MRADGRSARQRHARHADTPHAPGEDGVRELRDVPGAATCMGTVSVSPGVYVSFGNPVSDGKSPAVGEKDSNERSYGKEMTRSARAAREPSSGKGVG